MFKSAKKLTQSEPKTIISDGAHNFGVAIVEELPHTIHVRDIRLGGNIHNNKMDRMNRELRDPEKIMRSLKSVDTPILKRCRFSIISYAHTQVWEIKLPQKCGIKIEGENKWLTLIQNASHGEERKDKFS